MARGAALHREAGIHPATLLPIVVGCLGEKHAQWWVQDALRGRATVHLVNSVTDLMRELKQDTGQIVAVIVGAQDNAGTPAAPVVRQITAELPKLPVVAYCHAGVEHSAEILALATAGVHELLFERAGDSGVALRAVLASAARTCAAEAVLAALAPCLPSRLQPFLESALGYPEKACTVSAIARMLGVHRKTLFNQCIESQLPPPSELLIWCRLLLAAHLLAVTLRTVESVALELQFPSDTSLRNMMKRHVGLTSSEVREHGGLVCVLEAFRGRLAQRQAG
jgi:AraC-like DNA-binding protein